MAENEYTPSVEFSKNSAYDYMKNVNKILGNLDELYNKYHKEGIEASLKLQGETNQRRSLELLKDLNQAIGASRAVNEIILMLRLNDE